MRTRHLTLTALTAAAVLAPAIPAQAAPAIGIYRVWYDSPGKDTRTNKSLNAEWVQIKNSSKTARSLKGWTLRDKSGHVYTFGAFTLKAGKTMKVHTGSGTNTAANRFQGRKAYVWNNTGDKATLKTASGGAVDSCSWGKGVSKYC